MLEASFDLLAYVEVLVVVESHRYTSVAIFGVQARPQAVAQNDYTFFRLSKTTVER
jgi:hypothetical protein